MEPTAGLKAQTTPVFVVPVRVGTNGWVCDCVNVVVAGDNETPTAADAAP
jgi:hypothetical protein